MTKIIETQIMIHRTTEYAKESSLQLHRTDVSQEAFAKEMKARAQRELHKPVGVANVDGDIMIKEEQETDKRKHPRHPGKKTRAEPKGKTGGTPDNEDSTSTIDIRI
ncbi:MAG: hypothetical protein ACOYU3_07840 [Bacillota bacterium]